MDDITSGRESRSSDAVPKINRSRWAQLSRITSVNYKRFQTALAAWSGVSAWTNTTDDLFFSLKRPDWALAEVPFLWLSIAALMVGVGRYSTLAIWLLLPYLLWVTFAAVLNFKIVRLNQPFRARARD
jgi:tryptophan-rich sensory protein